MSDCLSVFATAAAAGALCTRRSEGIVSKLEPSWSTEKNSWRPSVCVCVYLCGRLQHQQRQEQSPVRRRRRTEAPVFSNNKTVCLCAHQASSSVAWSAKPDQLAASISAITAVEQLLLLLLLLCNGTHQFTLWPQHTRSCFEASYSAPLSAPFSWQCRRALF